MTEPTQSKSVEYVPKQTLRTFVQALLSAKVKGNKQEAERVTGVDKGVFYWHLKQHPAFRQWYNDECDKELLSIRRTIDLDLIKESGHGNTSAMKLYYQLIGRLKGDVQQQVNIDARNTEVNIYPQFDIIFQDVIPTNGNQLTDTAGDDTASEAGVHAPESAAGDIKQLPI